MSTEFAAEMASQKRALQPLRVLASDFFAPYWKHIVPGDLTASEIQIVKEAARAAVDLSMGGESEYWQIDLSPASALRAWRLFDQRTKGLSEAALGIVRSLALQLLASHEENVAADELLGFVTRVAHQWDVRGALGVTAEDADILAAAHEGPRGEFLDMYDLTEEYLASESPWDRKLRSQTPDLPEHVATIFGAAYGPRAALPLFRRNLRDLLETEALYRSFIKRLERAYERSQADHEVKVKFPAMLHV